MNRQSAGRLVCVLASFLPAAGLAQSDGREFLAHARSSFSDLQYERALDELQQAERAPGNSRSDLVAIHALRGKCLLSLRRTEEAERAFLAALSIDPTYRIDDDASPVYREPFERVLKAGVRPLSVNVQAPAEAVRGESVPFRVRIEADPAKLAAQLVLYHRHAGSEAFSSVRVVLQAGPETSMHLPADIWAEAKGPIEWYAKVFDRYGGLLIAKADRNHPLVVAEAKPKPKPSAVAVERPLAIERPIVPPKPVEIGPAWYQRWWVWAIVGGVVVGTGATVAAFALTAPAPDQRTFSVTFE